jgi:hypothetical protein
VADRLGKNWFVETGARCDTPQTPVIAHYRRFRDQVDALCGAALDRIVAAGGFKGPVRQCRSCSMLLDDITRPARKVAAKGAAHAGSARNAGSGVAIARSGGRVSRDAAVGQPAARRRRQRDMGSGKSEWAQLRGNSVYTVSGGLPTLGRHR